MPVDWSPLVELLRGHDRPLLMTHVRPDPDGLGSQLALREALLVLGKQPRAALASKLPPRYEFLDPDRTLLEDFAPDRFTDCDCVIILDTGTWGQLGHFGDWLRGVSLPRAVVDHHQTQDDLGGLRLVDPTAEATGRLTHELIGALGVPVSRSIARHLFLALAADTGWFRHSNTKPATFALAAELTAAGAEPSILYEHLYETATPGRLRLLGRALERLQLAAGGRVAFTEIYRDDFAATGSVPGDTEDLINYPRSLAGVEVALLFVEQPDGGTKVSFRGRSRIDVARLAERFGGGGHRAASGAISRLPLSETRTAVLTAVEAALANDS